GWGRGLSPTLFSHRVMWCRKISRTNILTGSQRVAQYHFRTFRAPIGALEVHILAPIFRGRPCRTGASASREEVCLGGSEPLSSGCSPQDGCPSREEPRHVDGRAHSPSGALVLQASRLSFVAGRIASRAGEEWRHGR